MLGLQAFISCGKEGSGDACRKPSPGMWHLLERHLNGGVPIDKERLSCSLPLPCTSPALLSRKGGKVVFEAKNASKLEVTALLSF